MAPELLVERVRGGHARTSGSVTRRYHVQVDDRISAPVAEQSSSDRQRRIRWGSVQFRLAWPVRGERGEHDVLERSGVLGQADGAVRSLRGDQVAAHDRGCGGAHVDGSGAVSPTDLDLCSDETGRHRVAVAPHRHERVGGDLAGSTTSTGNAAEGNAISGSASAASPTVIPLRRRASPTSTAKRSKLACASMSDVTCAVRHHRCVKNPIVFSTTPCGCHVVAGTDPRRRHSASRPERSSAGRGRFPV